MGEATLSQIKQTVALDRVEGKKKYSAFGALGDPSRFLIFKMLVDHHGLLCVSDVANILDISISAASQQLKSLENNGLILRGRVGKKICYRIKHHDPVVRSLVDLVCV